jgi:hypothetical protein
MQIEKAPESLPVAIPAILKPKELTKETFKAFL